MSELHDFEIFMVTARTSSFTEAAGEMRLSVATVSRAILRLENALDCRLY
ncbi:helix-turn-helix domain-containing protein [Sphingopyxis flava]|uniref:Regulatory helix-turn-helix protein, lysR family n=1 Tax=Sphingopyxis flava TaxID=1507287 RepID=A0A1T5GD20_9SPHN|nr:LysR family transcriptional regulator [Sphingopyxis flava]SKC06314.1 regulatory helix-turn-helix protein, lysR family [Sphingopyxis flava]